LLSSQVPVSILDTEAACFYIARYILISPVPFRKLSDTTSDYATIASYPAHYTQIFTFDAL